MFSIFRTVVPPYNWLRLIMAEQKLSARTGFLSPESHPCDGRVYTLLMTHVTTSFIACGFPLYLDVWIT